MGLLTKGTPLAWEDSKKYHAHVKKHGIIQFLNIYRKMKTRTNDTFLWGDEVEAVMMTVDHEKKTSKLCLRGSQVLAQLHRATDLLKDRDTPIQMNSNFLPEYGCFMVEATPSRPYGGYTSDLRLVEANMALRRSLMETLLQPNERLMTFSNIPNMGTEDFVDTDTPAPLKGTVANSRYNPDTVIGPHPRFATLTQNIRRRRGSNVCIKIPLFQDVNTPKTVEEAGGLFEGKYSDETVDPTKHIHMDAMSFGMGSCCLQVTFQARSLDEARSLYDHLAVLSPIMLALTASTPFYRGKIADSDVRWSCIAQSVDDRTPKERGLEMTEEEKKVVAEGGRYPKGVINKSRYDSIDCFISKANDFKEKYNDLPLIYDQETYQTLRDNGIDHMLSQHIAHLFIRDPLVIYDESVYLDDEKSTDHFENIQSTNWQSVRFKPPPADSTIGWRVEFRTMELQLTDFENAAFTVFIALLSRSILFFGLNLYIPISKVDENLKTAHENDAARTKSFWFRKNIRVSKNGSKPTEGNDEFEKMTMKEIMCGKKGIGFPGMIPLVDAYLDMIKCDKSTRKVVDRYLTLIRMRACGELLTLAQFLRKFVRGLPCYEKDSNLKPESVYYLTELCNKIAHGELEVPQLLGNLVTPKTSEREASWNDEGEDSLVLLRGASYRAEGSAERFDSTVTSNMDRISELAGTRLNIPGLSGNKIVV